MQPVRSIAHSRVEGHKPAKGSRYEIEAQQNKGYRLMAAPDLMTEAEIKSLMHTDWVAKEVLYFDTIDSTNTKAQELAEKGYPTAP
mgnify:CR=1 FL=1